jgi:hypothetical protein
MGGACGIRHAWGGGKGQNLREKPRGIPRRRWEDNIKMDLKDVGWVGMYCIDLVQDRDRPWALVNAVMNLRVPQNVGCFFTS